MSAEPAKSEWLNTSDTLPQLGRTVIADDNTLAWLEFAFGWVAFDCVGEFLIPRPAPMRWRYLPMSPAMTATLIQ